MTEHQIQAECFQWHWNRYPHERGMLHHNNNNSHNQIAGNKMKALGVVAGVADFELILYEGVTVWIEMKTLTGDQKEKQREFQRKVEERGHTYVILRTVEAFKNYIMKIYGY